MGPKDWKWIKNSKAELNFQSDDSEDNIVTQIIEHSAERTYVVQNPLEVRAKTGRQAGDRVPSRVEVFDLGGEEVSAVVESPFDGSDKSRLDLLLQASREASPEPISAFEVDKKVEFMLKRNKPKPKPKQLRKPKHHPRSRQAEPQISVPRITGIDIARGVAIYLMVQCHTVKSLLYYREIPDWGLVPLHAVTKISSSLFVIIFGVTLGVIFLPRTLSRNWNKTRNHLWMRALMVIFWYKVLIVVQSAQNHSSDVILDMLLYKRYPEFVEILNFYGWLMLILPLVLPLWRKLPIWAGLCFTGGLAIVGQLLASWDFFGVIQLKANLVEADGYFCYGLLTRGPLALFGIVLGDCLGRSQDFHTSRKLLAVGSILTGALLWMMFFSTYSGNLYDTLASIAKNEGKHPPELLFLAFSIGGSGIILGASLLVKRRAPWILKPFEIIGRESLLCFVWHICFIFLGLRWFFGLRRIRGVPQVSFPQALLLVILVTVTCVFVAKFNTARKMRKQARKIEQKMRHRSQLREQLAVGPLG